MVTWEILNQLGTHSSLHEFLLPTSNGWGGGAKWQLREYYPLFRFRSVYLISLSTLGECKPTCLVIIDRNLMYPILNEFELQCLRWRNLERVGCSNKLRGTLFETPLAASLSWRGYYCKVNATRSSRLNLFKSEVGEKWKLKCPPH